MSVIIAVLLMQAASLENKTYYNTDGYVGFSGANSCFLSAEYENDAETTLFTIENNLYFSIKKKNWQPVIDKRYEFKIEFDDLYYDVTATSTENGGLITPLHPSFLNSYAASSGLEITWGSKSLASLNLAGSSKAIAAFRGCMKDTGITVSEPLAKSLEPTPVRDDPFDRSEPARLKYYFGNAYPDAANGVEGVVKTEVKVGSNGRAIDCDILETSGSAVLDETACKGLRRSSFHAAKDRAGQPIESVIELPIKFEDPKKTVQPD
jgi:TonB family protein